MTNAEFAKGFRQMMKAYDTCRAAWIAKFGSDKGFDEWFTAKVDERAAK